MKRLHVHVAVDDLAASIKFYSAMFAAEPTVTKDDYAKWAEPKTFTAHLDKDMIATAEDVKAAKAKGVVLVDARPEDQYAGINRNPLATENGTLPGAKNLPSGWTTENGGGKFRPIAQLKQLYKVAGVPVSGEQITFCNTGHLASIDWFVSSELVGNKKAKLYAGSMVEWTMKRAGPVEQKVKLQ